MRKIKVMFSLLIALSMILPAVPVFAQESLSADKEPAVTAFATSPNTPNYNWTITNTNALGIKIPGFILGVKLYYDNLNLFQIDSEFHESSELLLSQTEINKSEQLNQIFLDNLILVMNKNMDNIFDGIIVDNESLIIQLGVSSLEQDKIDDIISYISKSSNNFTKEDIVVKNDNHEIIYP